MLNRKAVSDTPKPESIFLEITSRSISASFIVRVSQSRERDPLSRVTHSSPMLVSLSKRRHVIIVVVNCHLCLCKSIQITYRFVVGIKIIYHEIRKGAFFPGFC